MKSVVINSGGSVTVEEKDMPRIKSADDVLVKVCCSGLCGSDIPRIFHNGSHFYPITLGHEFSGTVLDTGAGVSDLKKGDLVSCVPLKPCFNCPECERQLWSQCKNYQFIGSRIHGGNCEYIIVPRKNLFQLPEGTTPTEGAFFEPMTVGLHAMTLAGGVEGKEVIIIGAGTIGLLTMQCASAMGAKSVTAIDINPERLELSKKIGATYTYNSAEMSAEEIGKALHERRFDQLILETAGSPVTVQLAIQIAGPQAQIGLIGTLHNDLILPEKTFGLILRKELSVLGSWMNYSGEWPGVEWTQATQLFKDGKIDLASLIAVQGDTDIYVDAVTALHGKPMSGKIMLDFTISTPE
ncbi:alcohol dehydrogenase catalytic domain-containing protein [Pectobacterium actinidiae]|uniref:alcohol dehydrogenase catalytic domain-containing protein n=1 Tax=Pectobacterium actinidiae TaxID=1507808 RepID=UPI0040407FCE